MGTIFISKYLFIVFALGVFSIIVELIMIKSATIDEIELSKYKDKDGLIPVPRTFTRYTVKEYYEQYYSIAYMSTYVINLIFITITIKILFFENLKQYSIVGDNCVVLIYFVVFCIICSCICCLFIKKLLVIKSKGINIAIEKNQGFGKYIIYKYIWVLQKISKTDDLKIANNRLWLQFFINKLLTIMLISIMFCLRTVIDIIRV